MVAVHYHVGESFTENLVLAFVMNGKSIVLDMYGRINKRAETTQDNLNSFPDVVLFWNAVSVSDFCLLDCWARNLYIVNAECRHIAKYIRGFAEHQKSCISEQAVSGDVNLLAELRIIHLAEINKVLCLAEGEPITFQSIEI